MFSKRKELEERITALEYAVTELADQYDEVPLLNDFQDLEQRVSELAYETEAFDSQTFESLEVNVDDLSGRVTYLEDDSLEEQLKTLAELVKGQAEEIRHLREKLVGDGPFLEPETPEEDALRNHDVMSGGV